MFCFVHIEKAAGITLHSIFKNNTFRYITLSPWVLRANDPENVFSTQEAKIFFKLFPYFHGFGGHTTRVYLNYEQAVGKDIVYFTFLRHPVERFISQYFYHKQIMHIDWDIQSFIQDGHFNNFMTKRICGKDDAGLAIQYLKEKFKFVGLVEQFDESLLLLKYFLRLNGYNMHYEIQNVNRQKSNQQISKETLEQIKKMNQNDLQIYEFVKKTLFPQYRKNYGPNLESDLLKFKQEQPFFRFNKMKLLFHGILRHGMYRPVEKWLHHKYGYQAQKQQLS
ncbi:hypothetical protein Calab_0606 [Caldithrix abyssi DSM 13497]|uniref:Sulfotransferase family protein n=1 Tax=Caldithrix abyssi DSM 13497 TaxID=880073 RepID=H1XS85_CALAY|nr:Sulfotransferase family protein [Caldithrix abyssi DSM 13497]EHO40249.1 hypothetical protein Calab_0606 [Caldithrix abyssi DSM 13497]